MKLIEMQATIQWGMHLGYSKSNIFGLLTRENIVAKHESLSDEECADFDTIFRLETERLEEVQDK